LFRDDKTVADERFRRYELGRTDGWTDTTAKYALPNYFFGEHKNRLPLNICLRQQHWREKYMYYHVIHDSFLRILFWFRWTFRSYYITNPRGVCIFKTIILQTISHTTTYSILQAYSLYNIIFFNYIYL
jgi:hypothetical protein